MGGAGEQRHGLPLRQMHFVGVGCSPGRRGRTVGRRGDSSGGRGGRRAHSAGGRLQRSDERPPAAACTLRRAGPKMKIHVGISITFLRLYEYTLYDCTQHSPAQHSSARSVTHGLTEPRAS
jgi:hypothetical protein